MDQLADRTGAWFNSFLLKLNLHVPISARLQLTVSIWDRLLKCHSSYKSVCCATGVFITIYCRYLADLCIFNLYVTGQGIKYLVPCWQFHSLACNAQRRCSQMPNIFSFSERACRFIGTLPILNGYRSEILSQKYFLINTSRQMVYSRNLPVWDFTYPLVKIPTFGFSAEGRRAKDEGEHGPSGWRKPNRTDTALFPERRRGQTR